MTKSFNSWWDVYAFLLEAPYNSVDVDNTFWWSRDKSGCYQDCECIEFYSSVEESMKALREVCDGDVEKVTER
jgi:hypothetical protein